MIQIVLECLDWTKLEGIYMNIAAIGNSNLTLAVSDTGSMNAIDMAMLKNHWMRWRQWCDDYTDDGTVCESKHRCKH